MQRRTFITAAAMTVGLALGVILGPTVRSTIANAQTPPPAATQTAGAKTDWRSIFLDKLAAALHIQRPALDTAIKSANTSTVDEAVKQGKLTQAQADQLKARIQSGNFNGFWGGRGNMVGGKAMFGVQQAMVNAAAKALNLTPVAFTQQLRSGQTLAQLAQAHGTTEQAVTSAALAAAKTQLDQAVTSGSLTRTQADAMYARLQQAGSQLFNHQGRGPGGRTRPGQVAPATPQAPSSNSGA